MLPKLIEAKYIEEYRVWLKFQDGTAGEVNLEKELWGEVFEPLKDKVKFAEVTYNRELCTIEWPNGADFAPEFLYEQLCPGYRLMATTPD